MYENSEVERYFFRLFILNFSPVNKTKLFKVFYFFRIINFYRHNFLKKPNSDTDISPNILVFNENLITVKPLVEFNLWMHYYIIYLNASKQNLSKLLVEIIRTLLIILFVLSL